MEFLSDDFSSINTQEDNLNIESKSGSFQAFYDGELLMTEADEVRINRERTNSRISCLLNSFVASIRRLQKSVGFLQGVSLLVGIIIGSGIFISPSLVIAEVEDVGVTLVIWFICGIIALLGALCYCELGTVITEAGGNYAYILYIYGPVPAFLCSWTTSLVIDPTSVAVICLTLGTYVMKPFNEMIEPNPWYPKAIALACILMIGIVNCVSIKASTMLQSVFAVCQTLSILFIIILGIWRLSTGHTEYFKNAFTQVHIDMNNLGKYGIAFYGALWSYNGWQMIGNVSEDMISIERDLLRTLLCSIMFITVSYLAINVSFLTVLSPSDMGASHTVAVDFIQALFGKHVAIIIPVLVALSCYGSANGNMFACGRLTLAAGREGHMPRVMRMIHCTRRTPIPSIVLTTFISILMLIPNENDINNLINYSCISTWLIIGFVIFGVVILRIRQPNLHRPFKVWLIIPIIMSCVSLFFVVIPFVAKPINSATALTMILIGLPVYFFVIYLAPKHPIWLQNFNNSVTSWLTKNLQLAPCAT